MSTIKARNTALAGVEVSQASIERAKFQGQLLNALPRSWLCSELRGQSKSFELRNTEIVLLNLYTKFRPSLPVLEEFVIILFWIALNNCQSRQLTLL